MKNLLIVLILHLLPLYTFSQEYVATLNQNLDSANLTSNDSIIATVYKGEKFIVFKPDYDATFWNTWTKDGICGSINKNSIKILPEEKVFKMNTDTTSLFKLSCSNWCNDNFKYYEINYCDLVKKAAKGDETAFLKILTIYDILETATAETNPEITWQIFNLWKDENFNLFLLTQKKEDQIKIAEYLVYYPVSYPITDFEYYYSTFYPKTWNTIIGLIEIKKKN
jgi:hypothetical protein